MIRLEDMGIHKNENVTSIGNLGPSYVFEFESLSRTAKTIIESRHRHIPVVSKKHDLKGIITYMDILGALLRGLSRNTMVSVCMTKDVVFCEIDDSVGTASQKMKISRRGCLPIVEKSKLAGMVSESDFIKMIAGKYLDEQVGAAMSHKPFTIGSNTSIMNCMKTMVNTHYRRLPVVENKEIRGIITGYDIVKYLDEVNYNPTSLDRSVNEIMSSQIIFTTEHDDVSDAVKLMVEHDVGGLPVIDESNALKGIITERDIIELI